MAVYPQQDPGPLVPHNIKNAEKPVKLAYAVRLRELDMTVRNIGRLLGIGPHTALRWLADWDAESAAADDGLGPKHIDIDPERFRTGPRRKEKTHDNGSND